MNTDLSLLSMQTHSNILLTGATGFLGSHLAKALCNSYNLFCLKRCTSDTSRVEKIYNQCQWFDIEDISIESFVVQYQIDIIIHCATDYGRQKNQCFAAVNADLILPLALLEKGHSSIKLFINTDSFFAKGLNGRIKEPAYLWTYTISKAFFSTFAKNNASILNCAFVNLCLEHVYGNDEGNEKFVNFVLKALLSNVDFLELTEGTQERDWIYIEDVVSAFIIVLANLDKFKRNEFYNFEVGTGKTTTVRSFVKLAKEITNSSTKLIFGQKQMNYGELMSSKADSSDLQKLGWTPVYSLEDGIRKILQEKSK